MTRLTTLTPISATAPGTIARSLIELMAEQLSDFYEVLDFNSLMWSFSTARGQALDRLALLFGTSRRTLTDNEQIAASTGSFYFYIDAPIGVAVNIPAGTQIYTNADSFVGRQLSFETVGAAQIAPGGTKTFASIQPLSSDGLFSVGKSVLTSHNLTGMPTTVRCTNPKPINATASFESDDDFRARVSSEIRRIASSNEFALRFGALTVEGVRDVQVRSYGFGLGTVDVLVVAQDPNVQADVVARVKTNIDQIRAAGITAFVRAPTLLHVNVDIGVIVRPDSTASQSFVAAATKQAVNLYLNGLTVGDSLIYYQMITKAVEAHPDTQDIVINSFSVDERAILKTNYYPGKDEQLIPGEIAVNIAT